MHRTLIVVPVLAAACWSSDTNKDLEHKVDVLAAELARSQAAQRALETELHRLIQANKDGQHLGARLDEMNRKLDAIASRPAVPATRPARREPDPTKVYAVPIGPWQVEGPADAKVTLVVAREYACPYSEKARSTLVDLRKKYGKDLRIVYKQLVVHPFLATASALAICAATKQGEHDKFDVMLWDRGFLQRNFDVDATLPNGTTQPCWDTSDGCPVVLGFAKELGLDLARFKRDMEGACRIQLHDTAREMLALGVNGTPTFFINGRYLGGAQPIDKFTALIDEELKKADERIQRGTKRARYYQEWVVDRGETTITLPTQPNP